MFGHHPKDLYLIKTVYSPTWPVDDSFRSKTDKIAEHRWLRLCTEFLGGDDIKGTMIYDPATKKISIRGSLHTIEPSELTDKGQHRYQYDLNAFDIQDCATYKDLTKRPDISKTLLIKDLTKIVEHRPWFDEDDETNHAMLRIENESSLKPFWVYMASVTSSNNGYFVM